MEKILIKSSESIANHCSLRTGGIAKELFVPEDLDDLSSFLKHNTSPILILGLGSNILVRDSGFNGVVVKLNNLKHININNSIVKIGAGATLAKLSRLCEANKLYGAEFLSAIPGSVGGALAMNAGAFGYEFWDFVVNVTTVDKLGNIFQRNKSEFEIAYRSVSSNNNDEFFIGAELEFKQKKPTHNIKQLLEKRNKLQPIGLPSCGSVFKNPKNNFAAKLIEDSNLKGFCIGGACISNKHANFIINKDNASATDVENLIKHIQQTVKSNFCIDLETEVKII